MSIQRKIILFFTLMVILPILILSLAFYTISSGILQEKVSTSNLLTIRQTGSNIESMMEEVHRLSLELIQNPDIRLYLSHGSSIDEDYQRYHLAAVNLIHRMISMNTSVHSIYILSADGRILKMRQEKESFSKQQLTELDKLKGMYLWSHGLVQNYDQSFSNSIFLSRSIKNIEHISDVMGYLRIDISEDKIFDLLRYSSSLGETVLIDSAGYIVSSLDKSEIGRKIDLLPSLIELFNRYTSGYKVINENGISNLITYYSINNSNWILVNRIPIKELLKEMKMIRNVLLYSVLISFIIFASVSYFFINSALRPLRNLRDAMARFERGDFDASIDIRGHDEIALVAHSFNQMTEKVKDLMDQVYLSTIRQKEAEFKALQNQINPHFLYNTLDTIYWMSLLEKAENSARLIHALGNLFRLSLNSGNRYTTVEKEIEHLKNYMIIQNERYEYEVDFKINVDDSLRECKVLKLILQPLVENSLFHGIEPMGDKGIVTLNIFKEKSDLIYKLSDNGVGADEARVRALIYGDESIDEGKGFALKNVHERIQLHNGTDYGIEFHSSPGSGSTVIVKQTLDEGES